MTAKGGTHPSNRFIFLRMSRLFDGKVRMVRQSTSFTSMGSQVRVLLAPPYRDYPNLFFLKNGFGFSLTWEELGLDILPHTTGEECKEVVDHMEYAEVMSR